MSGNFESHYVIDGHDRMDASYITSAAKAEQLPSFELPEVAFMGRSNCGKSSLINALANRKNLARASSTPGRTQMINFFDINKKVIFADLPGYGFNVARNEVRKLWDMLVKTYIDRPNIKYFCFLVDGRRCFEDFEYQFISDLQKKTNVMLVLTKIDKMKRPEVKKAKERFSRELTERNIPVAEIVTISSLKKQGINELRSQLVDG